MDEPTILEDLLRRKEGKTLEFKSNCSSMQKILQTVVAFANTAGGNIVIGVNDQTNEVLGLKDVLKEEERLANAISDSIAPLLLPLIEVYSFRKKELIIIRVSCGSGPFYMKSQGLAKGAYIRLGSTNRIADKPTLDELDRVANRISFDELPCVQYGMDCVDWQALDSFFITYAGKKISTQKKKNLGLITGHLGRPYPSNAAIILACKNREASPFPDAVVRCARFQGVDKDTFIDHQDITENLVKSLEIAEKFVVRNTAVLSKIESIKREDIPEYPLAAFREALTNAILHTDYSVAGSTITVAVFDDRIEITNPGALPYGMTLELATSGASKLRNKVIGSVLKELGFVEQWGSGIRRIISIYKKAGLKPPIFQELGNQFRVTLFSRNQKLESLEDWVETLVTHLEQRKSIQPKEAAQLWGVSDRAARARLKKLVDDGVLIKIGTAKGDPLVKYALAC